MHEQSTLELISTIAQRLKRRPVLRRIAKEHGLLLHDKPPVTNDDIGRFVNSLEDQLGIRVTGKNLRIAFDAAPSLKASVGRAQSALRSDIVHRRYNRKQPSTYRDS